MNTHELKLATEPFAAIKKGTKIIESRLFDEKRQGINLGDKIIFINREDPSQTISAQVAGLLRYPSFEKLFTNNDPAKFGGPSVEWLLDQIREFYPVEEEQKYGVVGIQLRVIE